MSTVQSSGYFITPGTTNPAAKNDTFADATSALGIDAERI